MSATPHDHSALPDSRLQLADLTIDPVAARVTRGPDEIPLPRLSWELLMVLVELAPGMVTTETLLNRVWPGLVVNPETVGQRVKLLRTALNDDPRQPRYIEVVRGRGWRIASPVVRLAATADALSPPAAPVPETAPPVGRRLLLLAMALAVVAMLGAGLLLHSRRAATVNMPAAPAIAVDRRSIAVLPFLTPGTTREDQELAVALSDDVRHQLSTLGDVQVIARSSSITAARMDVRSAGASLGVAYLLEGTVQRIASQLHVTVQLVDAATGVTEKSLQYDRSVRDVLAVLDEIALSVAQALGQSLDAAVARQLVAARGTANDEAWFEYVKGRSLLDGERVADLAEARQHLDRAIKMDGDFAQAYVELGTTLLRQAEFDAAGDRRTAFEAARQAAELLFKQALANNPQNGPAHLQRAYLMTFSDRDREAAEGEYRLGLTMAPNDAAGYAGLAAVIYENPQRHAEALEALDHARHLDPFEPRYDITKSGFLFYGRGDIDAAQVLVQKVLDRQPKYAPALNRMAELNAARGHHAQAIHYGELALESDPSFDWARRELISLYLDLGETRAAGAVRAEAPRDLPVRGLELLLDRGQWRAAGDLAYASLEAGTVMAFDEPLIALALRRDARVTGDFDAALAEFESLVDLRWSTDGEPQFPDYTDLRLYVAGYGDLLLQEGKLEEGRRVLRSLLKQIEDARVKWQRGGYWTHLTRAQALVLLGDPEGAMQALRDSQKVGLLLQRHHLRQDLEPAFDSLRGRADYSELLAGVARQVQEQKSELQKLRHEGLVPKR